MQTLARDLKDRNEVAEHGFLRRSSAAGSARARENACSGDEEAGKGERARGVRQQRKQAEVPPIVSRACHEYRSEGAKCCLQHGRLESESRNGANAFYSWEAWKGDWSQEIIFQRNMSKGEGKKGGRPSAGVWRATGRTGRGDGKERQILRTELAKPPPDVLCFAELHYLRLRGCGDGTLVNQVYCDDEMIEWGENGTVPERCFSEVCGGWWWYGDEFANQMPPARSKEDSLRVRVTSLGTSTSVLNIGVTWTPAHDWARRNARQFKGRGTYNGTG
ncbi:hypothetical protein EDB83DRAFT_2315015 [Lactarius deliciosus]|nr:hypothetical protein EDB83DRAFT_2315015 [Lactarius deliciosus]